jgi:hypothetical protein
VISGTIIFDGITNLKTSGFQPQLRRSGQKIGCSASLEFQIAEPVGNGQPTYVIANPINPDVLMADGSFPDELEVWEGSRKIGMLALEKI